MRLGFRAGYPEKGTGSLTAGRNQLRSRSGLVEELLQPVCD